MEETLKMRVNISLGYTCEGRCMDKTVEFEVPVTSEEKELLGALPECDDGKTTELQTLIPADLYCRMREAALHHVEDELYVHGFENGLYILDARKWFLKDLLDKKFCNITGDGNIHDLLTGDSYYEYEEEFFELWQKYESKLYKERGVAYLRERYGEELKEQTDIASVNWSMEF